MNLSSSSESSASFSDADDVSNHDAHRGDAHKSASASDRSSPATSSSSSSSLEVVEPSRIYLRRRPGQNGGVFRTSLEHDRQAEYLRKPRPAVPYPVTPRERDMTIFRLKKQLLAASIFRSPSPSSLESDSESELSSSASTISEQSPVHPHSRRTQFQRRGIDVWATPVTPERTSSRETSAVEHQAVRHQPHHHVDAARLPSTSAANELSTTVIAGPSHVLNAPKSFEGKGTRRPHQPVSPTRSRASRALPEDRSYDERYRVDNRRSGPFHPLQQHHHDSHHHRAAQPQRDPTRRSGSPYVVGVQIASHSADGVLAATTRDERTSLPDSESVHGAGRGAVASQTDSSVQAALAVARTMLRKEHNTQTEPPPLLSAASLSSLRPVVDDNVATKAVVSVAAAASMPLSRSGDPQRRTHDRSLMTTPVETSTVSCEDATCQAVELEPARMSTACSTEVTVASAATATDTPRVVTTATEATTTSASVGVETSVVPSRACGTSTIDDSISLQRDRTPSPARIRIPQPTPKVHSYRSPGTSPSGRRCLSPAARAAAASAAALHMRPQFSGPITTLGRKTPPREHHHINSPQAAHSGGAAASPGRAILTASELLNEDQQIALRCIKFVVFSEYSRNLDFRANIGFTLREARACYDTMTASGTVKWGLTGVYRSVAGSSGTSPRRSTTIDRLIHNAMTEVIRGACLDWNAWFAGVSRRRVEETLSRLSDHEDAFGYVLERNTDGSLVQLAKTRVRAVSPVLF